jgi:hypothetical protein
MVWRGDQWLVYNDCRRRDKPNWPFAANTAEDLQNARMRLGGFGPFRVFSLKRDVRPRGSPDVPEVLIQIKLDFFTLNWSDFIRSGGVSGRIFLEEGPDPEMSRPLEEPAASEVQSKEALEKGILAFRDMRAKWNVITSAGI